MELESFLKIIPQRTAALSKSSDAPVGVSLPETESGKVFVKPQLAVPKDHMDPESDSTPRVVLIAASAAVGKTMLASHIARESNNPYWDLGKFSMGSGFFSGTLSTAYGVTNYATAIDDIRCGKLCLILDAADEAIVASTTTNYVAALTNLAEIVEGSSSDHASAIIFGRPETILDTYLYLTEALVSCQVYEVSYFGEQDAKRFVDLQVGATEENILDELDQFVDAFFERVKDAFGTSEWSVVGSFLGYAPVLDSMALFYKESDNPYRELNGFISDGGKTWSLIAEMLERVLERETEKFAGSFGKADAEKREFGRSAYSIDTQIRWLLADEIHELSAEPDIDLLKKSEWLDDLDQSLRDQFEVHPFLKSTIGDHSRNVLLGFTSVAFRDYILARYIANPDVSYLQALTSYWIQPDIVPSPMLSRFVRSFAAQKDLRLDPAVLMFLMDSHAEQIVESDPTVIYLEWGDDEHDQEAADDLKLSWRQSQVDESVSCVVGSNNGEISLCRSISMAAIDLPGAAILIGSQLGESVLGPQTAVRCEVFAAQCTELHLNATAEGSDEYLSGIVIRTERVSGTVRRITGAREQFSLRVPLAAHPWRPFCVESSESAVASASDLLFTALAVRRIAVWFSRGGMRFSRTMLDTIMAKGRASKSVFDFLMRTNRIWIDGPFYRLDLGFSIASVRTLDLTDNNYRQLIQEVHQSASS